MALGKAPPGSKGGKGVGGAGEPLSLLFLKPKHQWLQQRCLHSQMSLSEPVSCRTFSPSLGDMRKHVTSQPLQLGGHLPRVLMCNLVLLLEGVMHFLKRNLQLRFNYSVADFSPVLE